MFAMVKVMLCKNMAWASLTIAGTGVGAYVKDGESSFLYTMSPNSITFQGLLSERSSVYLIWGCIV